jgi:PhnB protein
MKEMITYLNFDGNAGDAMSFYSRCLGGELSLVRFSDPSADAPAARERIMHAKLTRGSCILMASDTPAGTCFSQGNNFYICLNCESLEETEKLFSALGQSGKVTMPLQDTFWGARFGMLLDQFGVNWMFSYEKPRSQ